MAAGDYSRPLGWRGDSLCGPETLPWFSRFNIKLHVVITFITPQKS